MEPNFERLPTGVETVPDPQRGVLMPRQLFKGIYHHEDKNWSSDVRKDGVSHDIVEKHGHEVRG